MATTRHCITLTILKFVLFDFCFFELHKVPEINTDKFVEKKKERIYLTSQAETVELAKTKCQIRINANWTRNKPTKVESRQRN